MKSMQPKPDVTEAGDAGQEAVARALAGLPPRRAPADLQSRVFAALQARRARSWWQVPVSEWPMSTRFAVAAIALMALLPLLKLGGEAGSLWQSLRHVDWLADSVAAVQAVGNLAHGIGDALAAVWHWLPRWAAAGLVSSGLFSIAAVGGAWIFLARGMQSREYVS